MDPKQEQTSIQTVDIDLDELLGTGTSAVMLPDETTKPATKSIFSPMKPDTSFLDKPGDNTPPDTKTPEEIAAEEKAAADAADAARLALEEANKGKTPEEIEAEAAAAKALEDEDILALGSKPDDNLEPDDKNKGGRPTVMVAATKSLFDKGLLTPFTDDKKIEEYTAADFEELIEANIEAKQQELMDELPVQFLAQLPSEMKKAYEYISSGGTDMKGMFTALAETMEIGELDLTKERDQKEAIRTYLQATDYGSSEEIEDEINAYADRDELEKKANQFKPKLDSMQQKIVQQKIDAEESNKKTRAEQSQKYVKSVFTALDAGKLGDIDIDNKTQNMLYAGLVQSNYPSMNGKQTNMLGHLLEKYQWKEPNHGLIAEALWLLADPEAYRTSLGAKTEKKAAEKTLRTLKTEEASKKAGAIAEEKPDGGRRKAVLNRPKKNFFGR